MGRPPLPLGTAGQTRTYRTATGWRSRCDYRDLDGVTREVQRHAKTKGASQRALAEAVRDRIRLAGDLDLTPDSKVSVLAEAWFHHPKTQNLGGGTLEQYRYNLNSCLLPGIGSLRVRELSVVTCDRYSQAIETSKGSSTAKTARSVLSGICRFAAQRNLVDRNFVRDTASISSKPKSAPKALTVPQVLDLRIWLTYDDTALRRDIVDLVSFMLATGLRIGEASALRWEHIDLENSTCQIAGNVIRIKGKGLVIQEDESSKLTVRSLDLPSWCVALLVRRAKLFGGGMTLPVFPAQKGGLRDPSNTQADLSEAFEFCGYGWVTSHIFRKTVATLMDDAGLTPRAIADQLGHARPSMAQDKYVARRRKTGANNVLEALAL